MIGALSFWTRRSSSLIGVTLSIASKTTMYPLTIYPKAIQAVFTFLFPFAFISFYPAAEYLGKDGSIQLPGSFALWSLLIGILVYVISQRVFSTALRSYESAGS